PLTFWEQHQTVVLLAGLGIIVLAGLVVWICLHPKSTASIPPNQQAAAALEALRQQPEDGALLSSVSQILRRYFSAVFRFPSGELTTAEFRAAISNHAQFDRELVDKVSGFLHRCDEQKFSSRKSEEAIGAVNQALA